MTDPENAAAADRVRVLYDISVLGAARVSDRGRTGVFRVVDQLARYLVQRTDLDVHWTAFGNVDHLQDVVELLAADPSLRRPIATSMAARRVVDLLAAPIDFLAASHLYRLVKPILPWVKRTRTRVTFSERHARGFDIVHSPFHALPNLERGPRRPIRVLTVYDLIPIKFPHYFERGISEMLRHTLAGLTPDDWVACISESTRNDLLEFRADLNPDQVRVTPLAAAGHFTRCDDADRIRGVRSRLRIPEHASYFLSVCTLEPRKNLRHLIASFEQARSQLSENTYLVLVGAKGWQIEELLREIAGCEDGKIMATGYVADEDLAPLYSDAIAFVYPSLYEGFGLPPLEAMQCGTPVITSANSSLPEVVGEAGLLVPPTSIEALAEAMRRVADDEALRRSLGRAGRERAKLFSWERCGQQTVQIYHDAIQTAGLRRGTDPSQS